MKTTSIRVVGDPMKIKQIESDMLAQIARRFGKSKAGMVRFMITYFYLLYVDGHEDVPTLPDRKKDG